MLSVSEDVVEDIKRESGEGNGRFVVDRAASMALVAQQSLSPYEQFVSMPSTLRHLEFQYPVTVLKLYPLYYCV